MSEATPKRLGPYELGDFLGRGGMATVYRAYQRNMNRHVAIKLIATALAEDETFIARFEHEVKIAAQLEHPHILPVYDFGQEGHTAYLVMRLLEGGTLDQRLRKGSLKFSEIRRMIDQIGSALGYAHAHGVIHRDLKPSNVLLDEGQNAYLTDFGIAKMMDQTTGFTTTGQIVGTPSYLAPEQWSGAPATPQTDLYAFGVMLFQMLTGELPFKGDTPAVVMYNHLGTPPPAPDAIRPDIPPAMTGVISRVLAKNPADRYPKVDEFVDDVSAVLTGTPTSGTYAAPSVPTRKGPVAPPASGVRPAPTALSDASDNERTITDESPLPVGTLMLPRQGQRRGIGRFGYGAVIVIVLLAAGFGAWRFVLSPNPSPTATLTLSPVPLAALPVPTGTASKAPGLTETQTSVPTRTPRSSVVAPKASQSTAPSETAHPSATAVPSVAPSATASATLTLTASPTVPSATPTLTTTAAPSPTTFAAVAVQPGGQISYGQKVSGQIDNSRFSAGWLFAGKYGDVVQIVVSVTTNNADRLQPIVRVLDAKGNFVDWNDSGGTLNTVPLPADGTYQVVVSRRNLENGKTTGTFDMTLALLASGALPSATATSLPSQTPLPTALPTATTPPSPTAVRSVPYGSVVAGYLPSNSASEQWTFSAHASDVVSVHASGILAKDRLFSVNVKGPGIAGDGEGSPQGALDNLSIAQDGTFIVTVSGQSGPYSLSLNVAPSAGISTKAPDGFIRYSDVPVRIDLSQDGKHQDERTFNGNVGDVVTITAQLLPGGNVDPILELFGPDNKSLQRVNSFAGSGAIIDHFTLPASGTYRVRVSRYPGEQPTSGSLNLKIVLNPAVPAPIHAYEPSVLYTGSPRQLMAYDHSYTGHLDYGQQQIYYFLGRRGDPISIHVLRKTDSLLPNLSVQDMTTQQSLYETDRATAGSDHQDFSVVLPSTGKYAVTIGTQSYTSTANSGDYRIDLALQVKANTSSILLPNSDKEIKDLLTPDRATVMYQFDGISGEYIRLSVNDINVSKLNPLVILRAPDGRIVSFDDDVSAGDQSALIDGLQLQESGTYSVLVTRPGADNGDSVGEFIVKLSTSDKAPQTAWTTPQTFAYTQSVSGGVAGEFGDKGTQVWGFNGTAGDLLSLKATRISGEGNVSWGTLIDPDGKAVAPLGQIALSYSQGVQVSFQLTKTGPYSIAINGQHCQYVTEAVLKDNLPIIPNPLPYTDKVWHSKLQAGGKATIPFAGKAADQINLDVNWLPDSGPSVFVQFISPDGQARQLDYQNNGAVKIATESKLNTVLSATGTYQIVLVNQSTNDLNFNVMLNGTSAQPTATPLTVSLYGGQVFTGSLGEQDSAQFHFLGKASQHLRLTLENQTSAAPDIQVLAPDGQPLAIKPNALNGYTILDGDLSQSGLYSIAVVSKDKSSAGPFRLTLALTDQKAAPTPTIEATIGPDSASKATPIQYDAPATGTFAPGSAEALYAFDGQAGQIALISVYVPPAAPLPAPGPVSTTVSPALAYASVTLYDPDGRYIAEGTTGKDSDRSTPTIQLTLPRSGRYVIGVRGRGAASANGTYYLSVHGILPNPTATLAPTNFLPFEQPQTAQLSAANASAEWTFSPKSDGALFVVRPGTDKAPADKSGTLQAQVSIYSGEGFLEATASAASPGDELRIPVPRLSSRSNYRIVVKALNNTSGVYTIYVAGSLGGLVVFNTRSKANPGGLAAVRSQPNANYAYFTQFSGENYEAFAQSADRQWVEVRVRDASSPSYKRYGWVNINEITVTYGNLTNLVVVNP